MTVRGKNQRNKWLATLVLVTLQLGCASEQVAVLNEAGCTESSNLLLDTGFTLTRDVKQRWKPSQHTGPVSFTLDVSEKTARIERTGEEPWFVLKQTVKDDRLSGKTLIYRVDMKGEGLTGHYGFEPKAGQFTQLGEGGRATLAIHSPNAGDWEWQTFVERISMPATVNRVQVGLVHQTGGVLLARNPSLVIETCDPD